MKAAFAKSGWQGFLRHRISYLEAQPQVSPDELAGYYVRLGDKGKAIASLEKAYEERSEGLTFLKVDVRYDNLRDDPRFQDLLRRVGFPQQQVESSGMFSGCDFFRTDGENQRMIESQSIAASSWCARALI